MAVHLRMTFLTYRCRLGFEPLCAEVADSWRGASSLGCRWERRRRTRRLHRRVATTRNDDAKTDVPMPNGEMAHLAECTVVNVTWR